LYNEEQVDEGRRSGNIYNHLREDIDRSRQMYEERTDERVRNSTDYFYQELVRLLAAGDAKALGI
jgi:molybdopterin converting factor small subunit